MRVRSPWASRATWVVQPAAERPRKTDSRINIIFNGMEGWGCMCESPSTGAQQQENEKGREWVRLVWSLVLWCMKGKRASTGNSTFQHVPTQRTCPHAPGTNIVRGPQLSQQTAQTSSGSRNRGSKVLGCWQILQTAPLDSRNPSAQVMHKIRWPQGLLTASAAREWH